MNIPDTQSQNGEDRRPSRGAKATLLNFALAWLLPIGPFSESDETTSPAFDGAEGSADDVCALTSEFEE